MVNLEGQPVPLYGLAHLLQIGDASPALPGEMLPVMVLKSGARRFAVWVDEFLTRERRSDSGPGNALPGHRQHFRGRAAAGRDGLRGLEPGRSGGELHAVGRRARCRVKAEPAAQRSLPAFWWWTIRSRPGRSRGASSRRMATAFEWRWTAWKRWSCCAPKRPT